MWTGAALLGLALSAAALLAAPTLMPPSYSWVTHTTSESAAQGVTGAWLARSGFVLFAVAVAIVCVLTRRQWGPATALHLIFATMMALAAVYSSRPWDPSLPFDVVEDVLHSVAATAMGFAFAIGVFAAAVRRRFSALDAMAIAASVVLPLAMTLATAPAGALQRARFATAYGWYATEAVRSVRTVRSPSPAGMRCATR
jgi:hypothetical protein